MLPLPESGDVRRRVLIVIDRVKKHAAARRASIDHARTVFPAFLDEIAAPVCRQMAQVLKAQGYAFSVATPAESVRLVSDRSPDDFIAVELDTEADEARVVGRVSVARGRRIFTHDRPVHEGRPIDQLTGEDVLTFLLDELPPFLER